MNGLWIAVAGVPALVWAWAWVQTVVTVRRVPALADVAPERVLKVGFAVLLLYVAWRLFRSTLSRGTA